MSDPIGDLQDRSFACATAATARSYPPERRLSSAQLTSYLDRRAYAVVGSDLLPGENPALPPGPDRVDLYPVTDVSDIEPA